MKLNLLLSTLIILVIINAFSFSRLRLMKTKNLKHFQKKLIRQYMSFLRNSEEFQNTKRERDSKF